MTAATWPKPYLLQIHAAAVEHGFIWIEDVSEDEADSLRQALYRTRRRADKAMAVYILPEYHLVTVGRYDAEKRRLPVLYNRLPSGDQLPTITPATPEEIASSSGIVTPELAPPPTPADILGTIEVSDLTLEPDEISGFVDDLMKSAKRKAKRADDND